MSVYSQEPTRGEQPVASAVAPSSWTGRLRESAVRSWPPERLLPDSQPSYVASWIYVFGAATIGALIVIVASGVILGLKGPAWWHDTSIGLFFNSVHLWAVELFFFTMVVHLWGKFFMAAWRGGRTRTWISGAVIFLVSIGTAFTGYVSQQNFDSQWISTQGKDAMNSVGIGAFFNVTNFGQMYTYHVLLLPVAVIALTAGHILLVRRHGVVPPLPLGGLGREAAAAGGDAGGGGAPPPGHLGRPQSDGGQAGVGQPPAPQAPQAPASGPEPDGGMPDRPQAPEHGGGPSQAPEQESGL
jgi:Cytochrome b(N-terminal)/b6/petB